MTAQTQVGLFSLRWPASEPSIERSTELAIVAEMTEEEVRERLARIDPAGKNAESIQDLMGHNLRAQVRALNAIFPDEED